MLFFCVMLMLSFVVGCGQTKEPDNIVEPPVKGTVVKSVTLQKDNENIAGNLLSVDLLVGTVQLNAVVQKDGGGEVSVTYESTVKDVATINQSGLVSLVAEGETIISASAGDKTHEIVLAVSSGRGRYTVTVVGGEASATSGYEGDHITLTPVIPQHKNFVEWEYTYTDDGSSATDLWINGHVFALPDRSVTVNAVFADSLYTLNVVGATVKDGGEGEYGGNTKNGTNEIYDITVYEFAYDTDVTVQAIDEPAGMMFVGWDEGVTNNRVGTLGSSEYNLKMPGETLTVWAIFSEKKGLNFAQPRSFNDANAGFKTITNGTPAGETADPELEGMNGYRLAINSSTLVKSPGDYSQENMPGSSFSTLYTGSQTLKSIFKNRSEYPVSIELYASQYDTVVTSGIVNIGPNETVTKYFSASLGFNSPYWGLVLRSQIEGLTGNIQVDMVAQTAATYPEGDKQFEVTDAAEYVKLGTYQNSGFGRQNWQNNALGLSQIGAGVNEIGQGTSIVAKVENMPVFDAQSPTTRVYFRAINTNTSTFSATYNFGTNAVPTTANTSLGSIDIVLGPNETKLFYVDVDRSSYQSGDIYFSLIRNKVDSANRSKYNILFQMLFNNVIGVQEV